LAAELGRAVLVQPALQLVLQRGYKARSPATLLRLTGFRRRLRGRPERVCDAGQELEALWVRVFGEPPSVTAPPGLLAKVLVSSLPVAPPYTPGSEAEDRADARGGSGCDDAPVYRTGTDG
jgi:hypothetical protein